MQAKKFLVTMIALSTPLLMNASRLDRHVERRVSDAIDTILRRENISAYRVKQNLSNAYKRTVREATQVIAELLQLATNLVFKEDLTKEIKKIIKQKFRQNHLSTTRIPSKLTKEYNRKCKRVLKNMQDKMWFNGTNHVTKEDIVNAVDFEIDYYFIQQIKDEHNSSAYTLFDSISDTWNNFISNISTNSSSSSSNTKLEEIHYEHKCSLCSTEYQTDERVGVLSCGHCFHSSCIKEWLRHTKACPRCKKQNVYLAKIYDSKEKVPGYKPKPTPTMTIYYEPKCPICIEDYQTDERIAVLSCGHCFHSTCIKDWFKSLVDQKKTKTCPMCRKENVIISKIYSSKEDVPKH
jgi:hypothetical protein